MGVYALETVEKKGHQVALLYRHKCTCALPRNNEQCHSREPASQSQSPSLPRSGTLHMTANVCNKAHRCPVCGTTSTSASTTKTCYVTCLCLRVAHTTRHGIPSVKSTCTDPPVSPPASPYSKSPAIIHIYNNDTLLESRSCDYTRSHAIASIPRRPRVHRRQHSQ
jgi:hypothetical protein